MPALFSAVSALTPAGPGRHEAQLSPEWTIGGKPNGGYLLAMLGRAATDTGPHPHPIAASAHYLHSPEPGPVTIDTSVLRAGRSASQLHVRMSQGEVLCVAAVITTATLAPDTTPYWQRDPAPPEAADREHCPRLPGTNPAGVPVPIMEQVDLRIAPADLGFARGEPSGRGELNGWLSLPHDEPFDAVSLLFAVDAFPPATFDVELTGWVPTLELTAYVRALPAPGPLRVRQRADVIEAQRVDETASVWDSRGRLVAQATQLAGIRLG